MNKSQQAVLVIEDDPANGRLLKALFEREGCSVPIASTGAEAISLSTMDTLQAVFLDLGLPDMDGMAVLEHFRKARPEVPVIVLTGDTGIPTAVKAIQLGAFNYFTKPVNTDQITAALHNALERQGLLRQVEELKERLDTAGSLAHQMGPSLNIKRLEQQVRQVAASPLTVLVHGETGTGKEVVARAIHDFSPRAAQPFIALDCGAIPENLMESELFGYEKGAFSGADRKKEGQFFLAQGGTLFLDEIANLPLGLQSKLLRVLQERQLQPLGGVKTVSLDVRIVAASNHDLEEEVRLGRFRQDLFFRLAEFRVALPALRERPEDIAYLAQRFMEEAGVELRKPVTSIEPSALELLRRHPWPGNVRELRNVVRQGVLMSHSATLEAQALRSLLRGAGAPPPPGSEPGLSGSLKEVAEAALAGAESRAIRAALASTRGNILQAAKSLQTDNKTLHVKLKKYGIRARDFEPGGEPQG